MNKLVSGAIGIEVKLTAGSSKIGFPDIIQLRGKRIKHIDVCTGLYSTPSGSAICLVTDQLFITLMEQNTQTELIKNLPLVELNQNGNRLFINKIVDMQRSYITFSSHVDPANLINKSVYFVFWYDEPAIWGTVQATNRTMILPLEITLTGLKTYFADNSELRNKRYQNLLLSFPAYTPSGNEGMNGNKYNKFLTLQRNGLQFFSQVPIYLFYQADQNFLLRLQNIQFDLQNSYIETVSTATNDLKTILFNGIIDDNNIQY